MDIKPGDIIKRVYKDSEHNPFYFLVLETGLINILGDSKVYLFNEGRICYRILKHNQSSCIQEIIR